MRSGLIRRSGAIAGRMACMLAVVVLTCVSVAHSQVIEEGRFPVKGGGVSGESFSLTCPPRLYVEAGGSVLLSCSATAVPEEGVRYEWEAVSGDGFHLLSASDELSPLFTAPSSGEGAEYAYRLTAMVPGVYATASVTVTVGGFVEEGQEAFEAPGEECGSFGGFGRDQEGCQPWEKAPPPDSFGDSPEDEGIVPWPSFPGSPGAEEKDFPGSSGAGPDLRAAPRLECPVAVFLEELETGVIECHAWDASGEEYLDYSWEPIGSTTRDYLDNPRLISEDSPTPSVVAPEAPRYETLESFRSGETMFRYRYRLTVTSRATGLSSSSEVEVYVSSSRPSVYCPLEIVVEEGETAQLDCEGVDPLSARMDYDEEGASILWEWEGLWGTSMAPLAATDLSSPLFTAPPGSAGKSYHYIASMTSSASGAPRTARRRVTVRVREVGEKAVIGAIAGSDETAPARNGSAADLQLICNNGTYRHFVDLYFFGVLDRESEIVLDCEAMGGPAGAEYTYSWTGSAFGTPFLSATNIPNPTFSVPNVGIYSQLFYTLRVVASAGALTVTDEFSIAVLVVDRNTVYYSYVDRITIDEGSADFEMDVIAVGERSSDTYRWRGSQVALDLLSATNILTPDFNVPLNVNADTDYVYTLSATSGAGTESFNITVEVRDVSPAITCNDADVFDDADDFVLDCSVKDADGATYSWEALPGTTDTSLLTGTDGPTPTFAVPTVYAGTQAQVVRTYQYRVTMSVTGSDDVFEDVTVTVRDTDVICWFSASSLPKHNYEYEVDEGGSDLMLEACPAGITGPGGPYTYNWRGTNENAVGDEAELLSATDQLNILFKTPDDVLGTTEYEFVFSITTPANEKRFGVSFDITVNNLDPVGCRDPADVYEESPPFELDCEDTGLLTGITWVWDPTDHLTNHDTVTPTFTPPAVTGVQVHDFDYTVTARVNGVDMGGAGVTVRVLDTPQIEVVCDRYLFEPYEGASDFVLDCSASGGHGDPDYNYVWTGRGSTVVPGQLSSTTIANPTFRVPGEVTSNETHEYTLTVSAENANDGVSNVTVMVLNKPAIVITCPGNLYQPYEGSDDIVLDCSATGAPSGSDYEYEWTARGSTVVPGKLSSTTIEQPTFDVPEEVNSNETYEYTLAVSADNAESATKDVTVTVLNKSDITVTCSGNPYSKYEGEDDFDLDCSATGAPSGSDYEYEWTARGSTPNTNKLIAGTNGPTPTFDVTDEVNSNETYEYTLTVSAEGAKDDIANVTVTVKNKPEITVTCPGDPYSAYEGEGDIVLDCSALGAPSGSDYDYVWTPRGSTSNTDKLIAGTNGPTPTFDVPDEVNSNETYEYTLTVSADNAVDGVANVTVRVLNKLPITVTCPGNPYDPYEGDADITLNCSASGGPSGSTYAYAWTPRGSTSDTDKFIAGTDSPTPTFDVPGSVNSNETYEYTLTVSAENAEDGFANVTVNVLKKATLTLVCTSPLPVYEGSPDFDLNCSATGAPEGSTYDYVWTGRGSTVVPGRLSSTTVAKPTFDVPPNVNSNETYEYTLTVSAENAEDASANVTVRVLNEPSLTLVCTPPAPVYEGAADFDLDCSASGDPSGSDNYDYVWTGRGSTVVPGRLSSTTVAKPTFDVPPNVNSNETYEYTLTVSAENAEDASANVTVRVLNEPSLTLVCTPPAPVYEGAADFDLDCSASGDPSGSDNYDYVWTGRGSTVVPGRLSSTTIAKPTFDVPPNVNSNETYEYTLTVSAENAENASANVTVRVLNEPSLALICTPPAPVYEGAADFDLDCSASGAPSGSTYDYVWTGRGSTVVPGRLSSTTVAKPTFDVPPNVNSNETYEYTLTVSAENAEDASANVTVRVLNEPSLTLVCTPPAPVYEGAADFDLDCSASGDPSGSDNYDYVWTGRGSTVVPGRLSSTTIAKPTFNVPPNVNSNETYEYTLTVSAENAESATEDVTVTVLNKKALDVACATPSPVYEGSEDFALDCAATGAPAGSDYTYVWTGRGTTSNTDLLISGTNGPTPTFDVPEEVDEDKTYEYLLTVSAENATDATAEVTVKVLNLGSIALICASPPLVYEGSEDFALDCSILGDTGDTDYTYEWTARGATANTDLLIAGTDGPTPMFAVPDALDETTTYEYLLTASAENAEDATAEVTVTVLNRGTLAVACAPPPLVYEGAEDFALDCTASGAPVGSDYVYVWTGRGSTVNTDLLTSGTDGPTPTFAVPDALDETTTYEYLLTVSADNAESASAAVTVTVLNRGALAVACAPPPLVYEGAEDFALDCTASGAPVGSDYVYVWTGRGSTVNTDLLTSGTDGPTPTFAVPDALDETTTYEYLLTVSADNAESASAAVTVTVLNRGALSVVCVDPPSVYEGSADFDLDCSASGAPAGSEYAYVWTARGSTANTALLIAGADGPTPTFSVPAALDRATTYEYLLTVSAENAEDGSAAVTVTVLNVGVLRVVCADPPSVYEGSEDFALDCSASGAPAGSDYAYVWTVRGSTANTDLLIAGTDGPTPTFAVPEELDATTTYEYLLTASAENAESGSAAVTVTVLNAGALRVVCADPPSIYEGSEDFALDCSASGAPGGSDYTYVWSARGSTANTDLLISGTDGPSPTFAVPDEVDETTTYEYLLTASAENAESGSAAVTVTVLDRGALSVVCADPPSIYEGSEDFALDCSASGAPAGSEYAYVWTAQGNTANTLQLSATDISSPTFYVPDEVDETTTYEYLLTVSAENAEDATAEVTVTVLNRGALSVVCMDPGSVYEGSEDITLDCSASGAPAGSEYAYVWTAQGNTANTLQLSATDISSPTFYVPDAVDVTTDYEYLLTVSAENAEDATAEVTVTVLNRGALSVVCMDPGSVYEGSEDITLDCTASGAPAGSEYAYVWTAQGDTQNTLQLSATDISSPTFYVPDAVDVTTDYEYLLTVSADNAEDGAAEVTVTVLDGSPLAFVDDSIAGRVYVFTVGEAIADVLLPEATGGLSPYTYTLEPVLPRGLSLKVDDDTTRTISGTPLEVSPRTEYTWQVIDANAETAQIVFSIEVVPAEEPTSVPVAESSSELPEPSSLGVTVSASSLRFGVQSSETQVSLDPMTDQISTRVSGPYHAGRMTLSPGGSEALDENGEMDLSIELASPVVLRREEGIEDASIVLAPQWSLAESCEQLSSQAIGSLYTEVTLSEDACRLLRFGGELDLTDVLSGRYTGSLDIILRSGESEETHSVDVEVRVVPVQRVITIGPGGVRFSTSREIPVGLTEEQNLSIYPDVAFLTEEKPNGVFELSNPSLIPLEVSVSARFGYTEATAEGREVVVEDASGSHLGDLSKVVGIHPGVVLVLQPGEKGLVRYGMQEGTLAAMSERGYAAFFDVVSEPRQYIRSDQMPEEVAGDRTARVTMRVPGVYVPREGASQLRAVLLSISYVGSLSATFLVETQGHPFAGEVVAYDGDGRELGRRETLVYTRSRVRIPLDRMPEEGTVFLRFSPRGSGRVPEPTSVEWDAPRRDIGDAGDKDGATPPATLVQKP